MENQYTLQGITFKQFSEQIDEYWKELMTDPTSRERAKNQGIEIDNLVKMDRREAITLQKAQEGGGLDEATIKIIVIFAPLVAKIIKDLWDKLILPKIEKKYGYETIVQSNEKTRLKG